MLDWSGATSGDARSEEKLEDYKRESRMFHFSHTMEAQLGGLLSAGLIITGLYEDRRPDEDGNPLRHYLPSFYVVKAERQT